MSSHPIFETLIARYTRLSDAEATLHELQAATISYPAIHMGAQAARDCPHAAGDDSSTTCWSLTVMLDGPAREHADAILRQHAPRALSHQPAPQHGRNETDQGALAWRHYVFATSIVTDWVGDNAGANGTTGLINSGIFADGSVAEGNPPTRDLPRSQQRPAR